MLAGAERAQAQLCHPSSPSLRGDGERSFRASLGSVFASYDNHLGEGDYQGLHAAFAYQHPWFFLAAQLPGYRLVRNGEERWGIGDVSLDARVSVYRGAENGLSTGVGMATTFPSGDGDFGFGMGHVMLMPGLWLQFASERLSLFAELSYGRALGEHEGMTVSEHAGHGHMQSMAMGSIVQPMNRSELEHAVSLGVLLHRHFRAIGRVFGALPVADSTGEAREVVALAAQGILGAWDLTLEGQLPVVGSPFKGRALVTLGMEW
jgi:hypothetical protein